MNDRELLEQSIKRLSEQKESIDKALIELSNQYWKYQIEDNKNKYNNAFLVYRNDCNSCPKSEEDFWDIFHYVRKVNDDNSAEVLRFEIDANNHICIKEETICSVVILENLQPVDKDEIREKWFKIMELLSLYNNCFE